MDDEIKTCALDGCSETFVASVWNQRFHSKNCAKIYTNARILQQYHDNKKKKNKRRICLLCDTVLSRYNSEEHCSIHQQALQKEKLLDWGWQLDSEDFPIMP